MDQWDPVPQDADAFFPRPLIRPCLTSQSMLYRKYINVATPANPLNAAMYFKEWDWSNGYARPLADGRFPPPRKTS